MQVNVYEARAQLSAWLEQAVAVNDVLIATAGWPIVKIMPTAYAAISRSAAWFGGLSAGDLNLKTDFHRCFTDDLNRRANSTQHRPAFHVVGVRKLIKKSEPLDLVRVG